MDQPVAVPEVMSADLPAGVFLLDVRKDDEGKAGTRRGGARAAR